MTIENQKVLSALIKRSDLTEWERRLIRRLVTHKQIPPRDQSLLDELRDKYLTKEVGV